MQTLRSPTSGLTSPEAWVTQLSVPAAIDSVATGWSTAQLRRWREVEPVSYPALDHHCLTLHMGRPRRIVRQGEGRTCAVDVEPGALSLTPHGAAFEWRTPGPVDYAELYVSPSAVQALWRETPDEIARPMLQDRLGIIDPLVEGLMAALLEEVERGEAASHLFLDSLFSSLWLRLTRTCSGPSRSGPVTVASLSSRRLQRVLDYVEENLSSDLTLTDLAGVAALSPFHFSRAFAAATGAPPYAYLMGRRVALARRHFAAERMSVDEVRTACGFRTDAQFVRMFKRVTGATPTRYRRDCRSAEAFRRLPVTT